MKISGIMLLVLMGLTPIIIFVSLIVVPPQFKWQPPENWRAEFGTPGYRNGITALSGDATNVYAGGHVGYSLGRCQVTPCDVFLKKYSYDGTEIWARQLGDPGNLTVDQISVGTDGVYVSGYEYVNSTGYAEKLDFNGNTVWETGLGTNYVPMGLSVISSRLYSLGLLVNRSATVITDLILNEVDLNGNLGWTRALMNQTTLGAAKLYVSANGVYVAASDDPYLPNPDDGFVSRYDLNGAFVWMRQLDSPLSPVYGLSGDSSGIYFGGWYLRKYDLNGNILWTTGALDDSSISASDAGVFLIGSHLQKYDPGNGNLLWSFSRAGGENLVFGGEDQVLAAGTLAVVGRAVLTSYQLSSSLIIAGINPPYSFLLLAGILGAPAAVILEKRRRIRKRAFLVKNKRNTV